MHRMMISSGTAYNSQDSCSSVSYTSYLVLQVLRFVVATVHAPDKVMEVVLEELLTVSLTH